MAGMMVWARVFRLSDGLDEYHISGIGKQLPQPNGVTKLLKNYGLSPTIILLLSHLRKTLVVKIQK